MTEIPTTNPEKNGPIDDNDRKFRLETIDPEFLLRHNTKSYTLITDWLETNEANETKVVCKKFDDGRIQMLLIAKNTVDGHRTAEKKEISADEYGEYLKLAKVHVEKIRYEFSINQDDAQFDAKYDEFSNSNLRVLEVGPDTSGKDELFKPEGFEYKLEEVSDNITYSGFRVATHI